MAKDVVSIYNQALSAIGTRAAVSSLTEDSREREVCTLWYEIARDNVLRAAFWPSTRSHRRLALLAERDTSLDWTVEDPSPNWKYAYGLPADMIAPRFMTTYARFTIDWYRPTSQAHKRAIMTDLEDAILQYSFRQDNPEEWDDSLYLAVVYALAMNIAMPLHGKRSRMLDMREAGNTLINEARANVANADEDSYDVVPDWIAARGYGEQGPLTKFFWPYGPALSTSPMVTTTNV